MLSSGVPEFANLSTCRTSGIRKELFALSIPQVLAPSRAREFQYTRSVIRSILERGEKDKWNTDEPAVEEKLSENAKKSVGIFFTRNFGWLGNILLPSFLPELFKFVEMSTFARGDD